jgi:hypothetical protein
MKRAPATLASGRHQSAAFEAGPRERRLAPGAAFAGFESMVDATTHAGLISVATAVFFTLLVQAALAFQKYRFDNGLILGTTVAAVNWYEGLARRKNLRPSRLTLMLVTTIAATTTATAQQAVCVLAAGLLHSSRTRDANYVDSAYFHL